MSRESIDARLEKLERSNRRFRRILPALLLVAAAPWLLALSLDGTEGAAQFVSKAFTVLDGENRKRAVLTATSDGGAQMAFLDDAGNRRVALGVDGRSLPFLQLADEGGPRASVSVASDGAAQLALLRPGGGAAATVRAAADGNPEALIHDGAGNPRLRLGLEGGGIVLRMLDAAGIERARLAVTGDGTPAFGLFDADATPRLTTEVLQNRGPVISTRRADGSPATTVTDGGLFVLDGEGMPRAALGVGDEGPTLQLMNPDGEPVYKKP